MSSAELSASELALVTNDKPVLVGANAIESAATAKWLIVDDLAGADKTDTTAPVSRSYDRYLHLQTHPDTTSASTWYLSFDLGSSVIDWDCLLIAGHNFGTSGSVTVSLEVGTGSTFSSVTEVFSTTVATSDKRIFSLSLTDTATAKRWSGEQYVRLKMVKGSAFTPKIGELWLGLRRHLPYKFDRELDDLRTGSEVVQFSSRSGVQTNYVLGRGRQARAGSTLLDTSADFTKVQNFWSDTNQGTKPFLFCENPGSSPADVQLMNQEPELSFPQVGPSSRLLQLEMREVSPYLALES
jgi:hypothetical protein